MNDHPILVTGAAGFIGFHVARRLLADGRAVIGLDNLNSYYDPALKRARLRELSGERHFSFVELDLAERSGMAELFVAHRFPAVVHLAAQAGVRHSLVDPAAYVDSNVAGFLNVLEGCRHSGCGHLLYASSSSVYGSNSAMPFTVAQNVDHPLSLYGATKKANELMAHAYAHLFGVSMTGLRFFTVYGPWGRPDMATWLFTEAILAGRPIQLFNYGNMMRDFTYIDDVVEAVVRLIGEPAKPNPDYATAAPDPGSSHAPWRIYNVGNHTPVPVTEIVDLIEAAIGRPAIRELGPMQAGDVAATCADVADLQAAVGFEPNTPAARGIDEFVAWYRAYHKL